MTAGDGSDGRTVPASRRAMFATWAALHPEIRTGLRTVGVELTDAELDPRDQLRAAAAHRAAAPADVPRQQLARATMELLHPARQQREDPRAALEPVLRELLDPELRSGTVHAGSVDAVLEAMLEVTALESLEPGDRWSELVRRGRRQLHPELVRIEKPVGTSQLRLVDGTEYAARIELRFEVADPGDVGLDEIAPRVLPQNWHLFNTFFCGLTPVPDRDRDHLPPDHVPVPATANARSWRHVFLERVGGCPGGWFPDTFLLFTWARSENQLILYYELANRRPGDLTQLKIDEGFVQIDQLPGRYAVTALKNLLFDDERVPSGGQFLAKYAFELGWLDHALNWFSIDARPDGEAPAPLDPEDPVDPVDPVDPAPSAIGGPTGMDAGVQAVLDGCEADVRAALSEMDAQWSAAVKNVRSGNYGLDACVQDGARVAERAIRYGARWIDHGITLVKALTPPKFTT